MKIMIVDDIIDCLDTLKVALTPIGYDVSTETNPLKASKVLSSEEYDVLITDIFMPELNGIELLKNIRKINPDIFIIIITSYGDINEAIECIMNRVSGFFIKPIQIKELINLLKRIENEINDLKSDNRIDCKSLKKNYDELKKNYLKLKEEINEIKGINKGELG